MADHIVDEVKVMAQIKRRAISAEQKEKRRQDILDSAKTLFNATHDYNTLLMKQIAENIGLTKGTLYLYFKTKEEVFLALYTQEFSRVFDGLEQALTRLASNKPDAHDVASDVDQVVEIFVSGLAHEATFLRLNSMLHTVLEQNIDFETALSFKELLRARLLSAGQRLADCLPPLASEQGAELLLSVHSLLIGCYQAASPTPFLETILQREEYQFMRLDFHQQFAKNLRWLLGSAVREQSI